jgi:hypothetical protein
MATTSNEHMLQFNEATAKFTKTTEGHATVFARGWSISGYNPDDGGEQVPVVTKLRQERGPRISNCVGDERSLAQCFREPLLRLASGIAPLTGHDWEGHNDNDLQEREGAGEPLPTVDWRQRLLFGCTSEPDPGDCTASGCPDGSSSGVGGGGSGGGGSDQSRILVFGDTIDSTEASPADSPRIARPPRMFADVLPHDCRNTMRTAKAPFAEQWERVESAHTACRWGTTLDDASH